MCISLSVVQTYAPLLDHKYILFVEDDGDTKVAF